MAGDEGCGEENLQGCGFAKVGECLHLGSIFRQKRRVCLVNNDPHDFTVRNEAGCGSGAAAGKAVTHSRPCIRCKNVISDHNHKRHRGRLGAVGAIPLAPDEVFNPERACLFGDLATKGRIGGDDHRDARALNEKGPKYGNRLPRTSGEDGDDVVVTACEGFEKEKPLVIAGEGRTGAFRIKGQDLVERIVLHFRGG